MTAPTKPPLPLVMNTMPSATTGARPVETADRFSVDIQAGSSGRNQPRSHACGRAVAGPGSETLKRRIL